MSRGRIGVAIGVAAALWAGGQAHALVWSLASDYSTTVNTASSTWSYRYKGSLTRDGNYGLLTYSRPEPSGIDAWVPSTSVGLPLVGKNNTGAAVTSGSFSLPNGAGLMHPAQAALSVASWLAPANMTVNLKYLFADADGATLPQGDNGILWYVERNSQAATLGSGGFAAGGMSGYQILNGVSVSAGDRLNFVVDPNGAGSSNYWFDSTRVDALISTDPWVVPKLINFDINGRDTNDPMTQFTYSGAAAVGSPGDFWNSTQITHLTVPSFTASDLLLSDGVTGTGVSFTASRSPSASGPANLAADIITDSHAANALFQDYLYAQATGQTAPTRLDFTISGLIADGAYDLYLFGTAGDYSNNCQFTVGGVTKALTGGGSLFIDGRTYVSFTNLAASSGGEISGYLTAAANNYGLFNGFQLVGNFENIPEPASVSLLALGGLALLRRRRRA